MRFFFTVRLDQPDLGQRLTVLPFPRRIPVVLSGEVTLLRAATASEVTRQCSPPPTAAGCTSRRLSRSSPVVSTERADAILPYLRVRYGATFLFNPVLESSF